MLCMYSHNMVLGLQKNPHRYALAQNGKCSDQ